MYATTWPWFSVSGAEAKVVPLHHFRHGYFHHHRYQPDDLSQNVNAILLQFTRPGSGKCKLSKCLLLLNYSRQLTWPTECFLSVGGQTKFNHLTFYFQSQCIYCNYFSFDNTVSTWIVLWVRRFNLKILLFFFYLLTFRSSDALDP